MTASAIKRAFDRLDAPEQAGLLKELAARLADALADADAQDAIVFRRRRSEERQARAWSKVRSRLLATTSRSRRRRR